LPQPLEKYGGADRDRTDGLLNAIQALSQLSYSPTLCNEEDYPIPVRIATATGTVPSRSLHFFDRRYTADSANRLGAKPPSTLPPRSLER
jgi:hypothetical protein